MLKVESEGYRTLFFYNRINFHVTYLSGYQGLLLRTTHMLMHLLLRRIKGHQVYYFQYLVNETDEHKQISISCSTKDNENLMIAIDYYLAQQIHPVVSRL